MVKFHDIMYGCDKVSHVKLIFYRWDLEAAASLPSYMISCYKALYTVANDIADMVRKEHGLNPINHLKKAVCLLGYFFLF